MLRIFSPEKSDGFGRVRTLGCFLMNYQYFGEGYVLTRQSDASNKQLRSIKFSAELIPPASNCKRFYFCK
jgi:hypothetical protein